MPHPLHLALAAALAGWLPAAGAAEPAADPLFSHGWRFEQRSGAALYRALCAACHQPDGRGAQGAGRYPALAGNPRVATPGYVATMVLHGRRAMPGLAGELDDEQVAAIANHLRERFAPTPAPAPAPSPASTPAPGEPLRAADVAALRR